MGQLWEGLSVVEGETGMAVPLLPGLTGGLGRWVGKRKVLSREHKVFRRLICFFFLYFAMSFISLLSERQFCFPGFKEQVA